MTDKEAITLAFAALEKVALLIGIDGLKKEWLFVDETIKALEELLAKQKQGNDVPPTSEMWKLLSELLDGEKLPDSLNAAIYGLCDGSLYVASAARFTLGEDNERN